MPSEALATEGISQATKPKWLRLARPAFALRATARQATALVSGLILVENGYPDSDKLTMNDYKKVEQSHRLSAYKVKLPIWSGSLGERRPFAEWSSGKTLPWYQAYNSTKHDRHAEFSEATFANMLDAVAGVVVVLAAQFGTHDYMPYSWTKVITPEGVELAIGGYFQISFPSDWPDSERYDFSWDALKTQTDPFESFQFPQEPPKPVCETCGQPIRHK